MPCVHWCNHALAGSAFLQLEFVTPGPLQAAIIRGDVMCLNGANAISACDLTVVTTVRDIFFVHTF